MTDNATGPHGHGRDHLTRLVSSIAPCDDTERRHLAFTAEWVASGAPLYRTRKPDLPATHLVTYNVVVNERRELLLVAHRLAGLWLPTGGHVDVDEDPWRTVARETQEELHLDAQPLDAFGTAPFFLTVTSTRGPGTHTDVSLWYLLRADTTDVVRFDAGEFTAIRWLTPAAILGEPVDTMDPHMHRFTRKLIASQPWTGT